MSVDIESWGISDIGLVRGNNEDVWDELKDESFFVVADGMGGHRAGEVAAREAVQALTRIVKEKLSEKSKEKLTLSLLKELIYSSIIDTNAIVYAISNSDNSLKGMGTTLCCLMMISEGVVFAHIGDSRIYRLRSGSLEQLTEDHTLTVRLIADEEMEKSDNCDQFVYKNILTRTIGNDPLVVPDVNISSIHNEDMYLLCTDGLTDMLSSAEIKSIMLTAPTVKEAAEHLIIAAKEAGGIDNITVLIVKISR